MSNSLDQFDTIEYHKGRLSVLWGKPNTLYYRRQISQHNRSIERLKKAKKEMRNNDAEFVDISEYTDEDVKGITEIGSYVGPFRSFEGYWDEH